MPKPFKPTYPQLALLDWLYERKGCRFIVTTNVESHTGHFDMFETDGKNEDSGKFRLKEYRHFGSNTESEALTRRLGGSRPKVDLSSLSQQNILKTGNSLYARTGTLSFENFADQLDASENFFHYNSTIYLLSKDVGYTYWEETGRALFEQMNARRAADRAKAERLVLVGRVSPIQPQFPASLIKKLPRGLQFPIPERRGMRPQAYATVVRETDKRLYLEVIHYVREVPLYDSHDPRVIQGWKEPYVERQHVIVDHATPAIIAKLSAIDAEYQEDVDRIAIDFAERMLPLMQEMDQRFFQKDNEREMVFKEAVDDFIAAAGQKKDAKPSRKR